MMKKGFEWSIVHVAKALIPDIQNAWHSWYWHRQGRIWDCTYMPPWRRQQDFLHFERGPFGPVIWSSSEQVDWYYMYRRWYDSKNFVIAGRLVFYSIYWTCRSSCWSYWFSLSSEEPINAVSLWSRREFMFHLELTLR